MSCKTYANTGVKDCKFMLSTHKRIALVPIYDGSNDPVTLADEAAVTKAAIQALCQAALMADRIFPLPSHDNVTDERGDASFFEFDSGAQEFVMDGTRTMEFFIPAKDGGNPDLVGKINAFTGQDVGFFAWDLDGNFSYNKGEKGALITPFEIDTIRAAWVSRRYADQSAGVMVKLTLSPEMDDANIRVILKSDLDFDGRNKKHVFALRDVTITEVSNTLTTLKVTAKDTAYESPITGMDAAADWYLYNTTDSSVITPSSVVETSGTPGEYTLTFTAVTEADGYTLNLVASEGFDPEDTLTGTLTA